MGSMKKVASLIVGAILFITCAFSAQEWMPKATTIISAVNTYRQTSGLSVLTEDAVLMEAAQKRADELAAGEYFAHSRPDGQHWQTILGDDLTSYKRVGENLGRGQSSVESVIGAWQVSSAHNALLLHNNMDRIGAGIAQSASGKFYFVLIMGKSR